MLVKYAFERLALGFSPDDFCNFGLQSRRPPVIELPLPPCDFPMANLVFYLIVQFNLIFGVAGLMWPDKLMPVFGLLMFPWPPTHRAIRIHGVVAVIGYLLVVAKILATAQY